ncbi:hypothetical protein VKT23_019770 [Stygiomarasmius scandens]|uniref:DNA damage-responsive protein 48 n=1 Tax=Marasmiellus scandens TaxID=2682957 RepID=A0ABR1IMT0_9AGAR
MNFINEALGKDKDQSQAHQSSGEGGLMGKLNNAMGGGAAGEKKEDGLDKAVDFVQEHVFHQGPQNNESAAEQAKDEMISDQIRAQYKSFSGKDFPIADK